MRDCRGLRPRSAFQHRPQPLGEHPRQVLGQPAARDVRRRVHLHARRLQRLDVCGVEAGGRKQRGVGRHRAAVHQRPHQRVAVAVNAAALDAHDDITGHHAVGAQHLGPLHRAHGETRHVEVAVRVQPGHLGGLSPQQHAAAVEAGLAHRPHDHRGLIGVKLSHGQIVEEEQRPGAGAHQVVHAHGHQVLAQPRYIAHLPGQQHLRAHAVGAGHQHAVAHGGHWQRAGEPGGAAVHQVADSLGQHPRRIEVDARVVVGDAPVAHVGRLPTGEGANAVHHLPGIGHDARAVVGRPRGPGVVVGPCSLVAYSATEFPDRSPRAHIARWCSVAPLKALPDLTVKP